MPTRPLFAFFFAALLLLGCVQQSGQPGKPFQAVELAVVERAVDGDTLLLENGERLRLIGIDAPEKGEKCFEAAKNRLQELVFGRQVFLQKDVSDRDKYGRLVRHVYLDGRLVGLGLVEEGLARSFEFEPDTSLSELFSEAEARAFGRGGCLWQDWKKEE